MIPHIILFVILSVISGAAVFAMSTPVHPKSKDATEIAEDEKAGEPASDAED